MKSRSFNRLFVLALLPCLITDPAVGSFLSAHPALSPVAPACFSDQAINPSAVHVHHDIWHEPHELTKEVREITSLNPNHPANVKPSTPDDGLASLETGKTYSRFELESRGVARAWIGDPHKSPDYHLDDQLKVLENILSAREDQQTDQLFGQKVQRPIIPLRILGFHRTDSKGHQMLILGPEPSQRLASATLRLLNDERGDFYEVTYYVRPLNVTGQGLIHRMITLLVLSGRVQRWRSGTDRSDYAEKLYRRLAKDPRLAVTPYATRTGNTYYEVTPAAVTAPANVPLRVRSSA